MENNNALAKQFNAKSLIAYALPTVITMIFMQTYTIVDGIFIAQYVGEDALAAVNIVFPAFIFSISLAMVFATGANAVVGKLMGEGKNAEARSFFTTIYIIGAAIGIIATTIIFVYQEPILNAMGADAVLMPYAKEYLFVSNIFTVFTVLQIFTQLFFITAGKPTLGFIMCASGGIANIILDYLFISPDIFNMGIGGAALATGLGATIPGLFGVIYFIFVRKGSLYFVKPKWDIKQILFSMYNGMSEFFGSVSAAVVMLLFNLIMMDLMGKAGVAAISAMLYIQGILGAAYTGFAVGVAPILSYKFGEQNHAQLKKVIGISFKFILAVSAVVLLICLLFTEPLISMFIERESSTFEIAVQGMRISSAMYLFSGSTIFISSLFTSLSNGKISAIVSVMRTLVFVVVALLTLPSLFGIWGMEIIGVWLALPVAEFLGILLALFLYKKHKKTYQY